DRLGIGPPAGGGSAAPPAGAGSGDAVTAGAGLPAGRVRSMRHEDLLSRLTGRAFKGRQFGDTLPATPRLIADRRTRARGREAGAARGRAGPAAAGFPCGTWSPRRPPGIPPPGACRAYPPVQPAATPMP